MDSIHTSSKNQNWCTPSIIINAIKAQWSDIALDPCSNQDSIVHALEEWHGPLVGSKDGLKESWKREGVVFVNPPYSRSLKPWVSKAIKEAKEGAEIVLLTPSRTDTKWWHDLYENADSMLLWKGRITFLNAPAPAVFPSCLTYFGPDVAKFKRAFKGRGIVL